MAEETALPAALYLRPEAFARERRAIFGRQWLLMGRRAQLAGAGDYLCVNLAGWPVFATRDDAAVVRGFRNQCRHQGMLVLDAGTGNCAELRCKYHGWTYELDGHFRGAPANAAPADPRDPMHALTRIGCTEEHGFVFIHPGETPGPLAPASAPLQRLAALEFAGECAVEIDANWKIVVEHLLGAADAEWVSPNLVLTPVAGGVALDQAVPRAFARTRLVRIGFGAASEIEGSIAAAAATRQKALEGRGDEAPPQGAGIASFRAHIAAAHRAG